MREGYFNIHIRKGAIFLIRMTEEERAERAARKHEKKMLRAQRASELWWLTVYYGFGARIC